MSCVPWLEWWTLAAFPLIALDEVNTKFLRDNTSLSFNLAGNEAEAKHVQSNLVNTKFLRDNTTFSFNLAGNEAGAKHVLSNAVIWIKYLGKSHVTHYSINVIKEYEGCRWNSQVLFILVLVCKEYKSERYSLFCCIFMN